MFSNGDTYSTFITWTKSLLPIVALALLSTLFMFSGKVDVTQSLPYAELNVDEIIREQRISKPYFTTTTATGTDVALSAAHATPDPQDPNLLTLASMSAQFETPTGTEMSILADDGQVQSATQIVALSGAVNISASSGFWLQTDALTLDLKNAQAESPGPIVAQSPLGRIEAGKMQLHNHDNSPQIVFTNGVRLVYVAPKN